MAARVATRPAREGDFSNVGKIGRRTGVTLPQGRVDINGLEEISGIFSSPRKPSPLKHSISLVESIEEQENITPPARTPVLRKSLPPRSTSPRKSGISGTARRIGKVDIVIQPVSNPEEAEDSDEAAAEIESTPGSTRPRAGHRIATPVTVARTTISKQPRADLGAVAVSPNALSNTGSPFGSDFRHRNEQAVITGSPAGRPAEMTYPNSIRNQKTQRGDALDLPVLAAEPPDESVQLSQYSEEPELDFMPPAQDDEDVDQSFEPEQLPRSIPREPTTANSRRKRKSSGLEVEADVDPVSSPAAKRAKRVSDEGAKKAASQQKILREKVISKPPKQSAAGKAKARAPASKEPARNDISARQQEELDAVVEKIKARPGQKKSLYILKREVPADDGVTHTRSGRISVKPLAYWRNERCVYGGGSPSSSNLQDGARFPLNSIKEIIRTEVAEEKPGKKSKKGKKPVNSKTKSRSKSRSPPSQEQSAGETSETDSDDDQYADRLDPDAEPWETENGTFRGPVQVWDTEQQAPIDQDENIDIAYASAAIETREVRDSTFRYAKLLSTRFLGTGIVELPPGGTKRPKNSTKMHMCFFVAAGRVTVEVGPINGPTSRFSIGKGGFWQVPRGNQYSIENEHPKTASLFFSQGCEVAPVSYED